MSQPRDVRGGLVIVDGAREVAARALGQVLDDDGNAQQVIGAALDGSSLSDRDKALCTELFYGALRFAAPLEASLLRAASKPGRGLDTRMRPHLLVAAYQLQHLSDRIPPHAVVSSAVAAIKRVRPGLEGFANALLRHLGSALHEMLTPQSSLAEVCLAWGVPLALGSAVTAGLPADEHQAAIGGLQGRPSTWGFFPGAPPAEGRPHAFVPRQFALAGGRVDGQAGFDDGAFIVMDPSSVLSALALAPAPGARVIDLCAAPGAMSVVLADAVGEGGTVVAVDSNRRRSNRIEPTAKRLGLAERVTVTVAEVLCVDVPPADGVLLDAPSTGLGSTRRKPEIARRFTDADLAGHVAAQARLLDAAARLVRPGGVLVYSVCSPLPAEGAEQIVRFVAAHPDFVREPITSVVPTVPADAVDALGQLHLTPHRHDADAIFVARLRRRGASE